MLSASLASARGISDESRHDCTPLKKCPADSLIRPAGQRFADVIVQVHHVWALYQVSMSFLA